MNARKFVMISEGTPSVRAISGGQVMVRQPSTSYLPTARLLSIFDETTTSHRLHMEVISLAAELVPFYAVGSES